MKREGKRKASDGSAIGKIGFIGSRRIARILRDSAQPNAAEPQPNQKKKYVIPNAAPT